MPSLLSTRDGLGFEELGQTGSQASDLWVTGSLTCESQISGANIYSTALMAAGSVRAPVLSGLTVRAGNATYAGSIIIDSFSGTTNGFLGGSLFSQRVIYTLMSGDNIINGGSIGTTIVHSTPGSPYYQGNIERFTAETIITGGMWVTVSGAAGGASVLARSAAVSTTPLGVAVATAGSNATVSILTRGYTYLTADTTISNATQIRMGAGGALNTVAAADTGSGARGVALAGAGSNVVALVYLW